MRRFLIEFIRAGEWWDFKLVPIFAAFYATALSLQIPSSELWRSALLLLLSMVPGAIYVSVINDITDRAEDAAAGKTNRMAGRSSLVMASFVALPLLGGFAFDVYWRHDPLLLSFYLSAWIAFSLYSLPPFRLKVRGIFGVAADASGAHLFPTLVAVTLAAHSGGKPVDPKWLAAMAVWAFSYGGRGILWHQLTDRQNDQQAAVRTFAERHSPEVSIRIGTLLAFPLEIVSLACILWWMRSLLPIAALLLYAIVTLWRLRAWKMNAVIVEPKSNFLIVLSEYYDALFPLAILAESTLRHPHDGYFLAAHLLLFPRRLLQFMSDLWKLRYMIKYSASYGA